MKKNHFFLALIELGDQLACQQGEAAIEELERNRG